VTPSEVLAVIPARGGSKGVPGKNIRPLAGRPLLSWTIDAAQAAATPMRVIVSTDADDIAEVASRCGAEVPMRRPPELAQDDTAGVDPILHAVEWLDRIERYRPDLVIVLQPTSPLRTAADIDAAVHLLRERGAGAVVSVAPTPHHPAWMKRVTPDGELVDAFSSPDTLTVRQRLAPVYVINGAIYLVARDVLVERRSLYAAHTYAYVMPRERSIDIDTLWDFDLAEFVLARGKASASAAP
jgi:CMP-N,N'-diacetyllegionaminic acid synthase